MSAHPVGLLGEGDDPPPLSTEPRRYVVMSDGVTTPRSAWVIWPIFSSSVMRASRSLTRTETGCAGSW